MDKIFNKPFAINGARVAIPENGTENERVSFDKGFTQPYEVEAPSVDNPAGQGFNILRPEMNEALYQLSSACNLLAENIDKWTALTTENLNNITQKGRYFQAAQSHATNANNYPTNETGYLIVFDSINNNVAQFYKIANSNKIFIRFMNGSAWSGWDNLTLKSFTEATYRKISDSYTKTETQEQCIGHFQTWRTYNATERALNVNYTNNTGRAIQISLCANLNSDTGSLKIFVGDKMIVDLFENAVGAVHETAIIPNGATYKVLAGSNTETWRNKIYIWAELR